MIDATKSGWSGGIAFLVALAALGVALACAWQLAGGEDVARRPDGAAEPSARPIALLAERLERLADRVAELELDAATGPEEAVALRAELTLVPAEEPDALPSGEEGSEAAGAATDDARARLRRLGRLSDPQERLALARELVRSANPLEQAAGARALAELAPAEAFVVVDRWLAEARAGTRRDAIVVDAARALEQQGDPRCMQVYVASLQPSLAAADASERRRAIFRLGTTRSASVTPLLLAPLRDSSPEIRIAALDALRTSGAASAAADVAPLLDDPVAAARDRAVRTLETLRRREEPAGAPPGARDEMRRLLRRPRR